MKWDPKARLFKPVIGVTLVGARSATFKDIPVGSVEANTAYSRDHVDGPLCADDDVTQGRYDETNEHGFVHSTDICGKAKYEKRLGAAGDLYFATDFSKYNLPITPCPAITPYTPPQAGLGVCMEFELDPYKGTWTDHLEARSDSVAPPIAGRGAGWGIGGECTTYPAPCTVSTAMDYHHWRTQLSLDYELKLLAP